VKKVGLIAGNGTFPLLFASAARKTGVKVIAVAIKEETDPLLSEIVDTIYWISVGELKKLIRTFQKEKIEKVVMAGQIRHKLLFSDIKIDSELLRLLLSLKDRKTDTILKGIANRLARFGIELIDSSTFLEDYLVPKGNLTRKKPNKKQLQDIDFGLSIAKAIAGLDIGQTIVVKDKVVLSVEAIEGTDEAIKRAHEHCNGQAIVVKVSKPNQDMRFDIPIMGKTTIDTLISQEVAVMAVEAGKTLLLDKEYVLEKADKHGIIITGI